MAPEIPAPLPGPAVPQEPAAGNTGVPAELRYQHARPGRPQVWLLAAAGGLGVLAGAAATVSYAAQYRLVGRGPAPGPGGRAGGGDPGRGCAGVRLPGRRPGAAGPPGDPGAAAERRLGGRVGVHERDRGRAGLAERRGVGDASGRLRAGERHADRGCPHQHRRPPPGRRGPGRAAEVSLLAVLGGLALWLLRLSLAPRSTAAGFRAWVIEECPVAPGRRAAPPGPGRPGDDLPDDRTTADDTSRERRTARTAAGGPPAGTGALSGRAAGGARPGAARRRPPGSWRSSPRSTGRWPASPWHRWRGSAPCPPPWSA